MLRLMVKRIYGLSSMTAYAALVMSLARLKCGSTRFQRWDFECIATVIMNLKKGSTNFSKHQASD